MREKGKVMFFCCPGIFKPLDSESKKVPIPGRERSVFVFLCVKKCACGQGLNLLNTYLHTDKQTNRQTDRQTKRQRDRQTEQNRTT